MIRLLLLFALLFPMWANAATINAASCTTAAVQTAVNAAVDGDTVAIPNGTCAWTSGIVTTKQIIIAAQNFTPTPGGTMTRNVTITNNSSSALLTFTSGNSFHVGVTGILFNEGTGSFEALVFFGSGSKVPLIRDCAFQVRDRFASNGDTAVIGWRSQGGVMWNTYMLGINSVTGQCCPEGTSVLIHSPRVWATASTMGSLDTGGNVNVYIEDSTWKDFGQAPDGDDGARFVIRYTTLNGISGLTHGFSSPTGGRHFEYYNNTYIMTTNGRNISSRYFWLRAGTGLWTDNSITVGNAGFGNVHLLEVGDTSGLGTYPVPRQPGWGHNGTTNVSDPIYLWNNTGNGTTGVFIVNGWDTNNVLYNRDIFLNVGAKPGYTKYTYPHPFRSGAVSPPGEPTNFRLIEQWFNRYSELQ